MVQGPPKLKRSSNAATSKRKNRPQKSSSGVVSKAAKMLRKGKQVVGPDVIESTLSAALGSSFDAPKMLKVQPQQQQGKAGPKKKKKTKSKS